MRFIRQAGTTLIEIVIACMILSVGLLGIVKISLLSLDGRVLAYQESIATLQLASMVQRLKANYINRMEEMLEWNKLNQSLLPKGEGAVHCSNRYCQLEVRWMHYRQRIAAITLSNPAEETHK